MEWNAIGVLKPSIVQCSALIHPGIYYTRKQHAIRQHKTTPHSKTQDNTTQQNTRQRHTAKHKTTPHSDTQGNTTYRIGILKLLLLICADIVNNMFECEQFTISQCTVAPCVRLSDGNDKERVRFQTAWQRVDPNFFKPNKLFGNRLIS